ncbi:MAG: TlpA disulfide reductase family protein [Pirellulaceae bacterium]
MRMVPDERSLVNEMSGRPFALVGVNLSRSVDAAKSTVQRQEINWRSFFDSDGKISSMFNVNGIPAVFLFDADGQLVANAHSVEELKPKMMELVKELETN